jgi:hypothetical protein
MTSQSLFWLLLGSWALAVVVTVFKLAFDVLAADARGAKLPAGSLRSAVRTCVRCGVMFTSLVVFAAIAKTIDEIWDLSLKPFSYDLTAYSGSVKQAVLSVGVFICLMMVNWLLDRFLDKLLPDGQANRTPTVENSNDTPRPVN